MPSGDAAATPLPFAALPITEIGPGPTSMGAWLREAWVRRGVCGVLAGRMLRARYRSTILGAGWALAQPLALMAVVWLVFGEVVGLSDFAPVAGRGPADGIGYALLAFSGLLIWQFFARCLTEGGTAITGNGHLVTRVYFPRLYLPLAVALVACVDMAPGTVVLLAAVLILGGGAIDPVALAAALALLVPLAAGCAFWAAVLHVRFRDTGHILPLAVQVWMFATPVLYPSDLVPDRFADAYAVNPLVAVIDLYRAALLGTPMPDAGTVGLAAAAALLVLATGLDAIRRLEPRMADLV